MLKTYIVRLSQEERQTLQDLVSTGKAAAYKIKHANILLNIDVNGQGWTDEEAATAFSCHRNTVAPSQGAIGKRRSRISTLPI
jgi:hypothetical protein